MYLITKSDSYKHHLFQHESKNRYIFAFVHSCRGSQMNNNYANHRVRNPPCTLLCDHCHNTVVLHNITLHNTEYTLHPC